MLSSLTADIENLLRSSPLVITIGNDLRADDGVGPYIFNEFQISNVKYQIINAGDKPENIIDEALKLKPEKVVIIDAADFGGKIGEARLIPSEAIPDTTLSTHTFPLKVIAKMLEEDTGSKVHFLGIQPKSVALGEKMCEEVRKTAKEIIECMKYTC